jgi:hypothetical protein
VSRSAAPPNSTIYKEGGGLREHADISNLALLAASAAPSALLSNRTYIFPVIQTGNVGGAVRLKKF